MPSRSGLPLKSSQSVSLLKDRLVHGTQFDCTCCNLRLLRKKLGPNVCTISCERDHVVLLQSVQEAWASKILSCKQLTPKLWFPSSNLVNEIPPKSGRKLHWNLPSSDHQAFSGDVWGFQASPIAPAKPRASNWLSAFADTALKLPLCATRMKIIQRKVTHFNQRPNNQSNGIAHHRPQVGNSVIAKACHLRLPDAKPSRMGCFWHRGKPSVSCETSGRLMLAVEKITPKLSFKPCCALSWSICYT